MNVSKHSGSKTNINLEEVSRTHHNGKWVSKSGWGKRASQQHNQAENCITDGWDHILFVNKYWCLHTNWNFHCPWKVSTQCFMYLFYIRTSLNWLWTDSHKNSSTWRSMARKNGKYNSKTTSTSTSTSKDKTTNSHTLSAGKDLIPRTTHGSQVKTCEILLNW